MFRKAVFAASFANSTGEGRKCRFFHVFIVPYFLYKVIHKIYFSFRVYKESRKAGIMNLEHHDLTEKIIGAAIEVHKELGPGFLESIYEKALVYQLKKIGLSVKQQYEISINYDNKEVGRHRLDLFVEDRIVVELKAVKKLEDIHFAIVKSYIKAVNQKHGLLLNFSGLTLQVKRVIFQ